MLVLPFLPFWDLSMGKEYTSSDHITFSTPGTCFTSEAAGVAWYSSLNPQLLLCLVSGLGCTH